MAQAEVLPQVHQIAPLCCWCRKWRQKLPPGSWPQWHSWELKVFEGQGGWLNKNGVWYSFCSFLPKL